MTRPRIHGIAIVAALALSACSFFRQDSPSATCNIDEDCFRASGELCLKSFDGAPGAGTCGIPVDAGPDATPPPDGVPVPDAEPGPPDAAIIDGGAVDAGGPDA